MSGCCLDFIKRVLTYKWVILHFALLYQKLAIPAEFSWQVLEAVLTSAWQNSVSLAILNENRKWEYILLVSIHEWKAKTNPKQQKEQNKTKIMSRNAFRNLSSHFRSIIQRKKMRRYSKSIRDKKSIFFFNEFYSSLLLLCWLYQLQSLPSLVTLFGRKGFITSRKHIWRTIKYGLLPYVFESKGVPKTNEKDWSLKYNNKISL